MILLTFVSVFGTETEAIIGVVPGVNGIITEGLRSVKSTPGDPELISDGDVDGDAPTSIGFSIYTGLFMPSVSGHIIVVVIGVVDFAVSSVGTFDVPEGVDPGSDPVSVADGVDVNEPLVYFVVSPDVVATCVTPALVELIVNVGVIPLTLGGTLLLVTTVVAVDGV